MLHLNIISWFDKNTVKHLRFFFSYHLMPVFLFSLSQNVTYHWKNAVIAFMVLHIFIFPSSNGYNSYQDRDETSIGGLKHPPQVTENLFYATLLLDILGVFLGLIVSLDFAILVLLYVMISRAYSYRKLRLKQYAMIGFLTVFLFQGAFTYLMVSAALTDFYLSKFFTLNNVICMSVASLFIGSIYPLTQIYQHEADKQDGVTTISYKLGYIGTFIFSSILFGVAYLLLFYYFNQKNQLTAFILLSVLMLPIAVRLLMWFHKVRQDTIHANFENTMSMNFLASTCMNSYFSILIFNNTFSWF